MGKILLPLNCKVVSSGLHNGYCHPPTDDKTRKISVLQIPSLCNGYYHETDGGGYDNFVVVANTKPLQWLLSPEGTNIEAKTSTVANTKPLQWLLSHPRSNTA